MIQRVPITGDDPHAYFQRTAKALERWLSTRRGSPSITSSLSNDLTPIGAGFQASRERATVDGFAAERWRFRVGDAPFIYDTRVTIAVHPERQVGWLQYDIDASREDSAFTAPKLTSILTTELESRTADSIANFSEGLRVIRKEGVGAFLDDVLNNSQRNVAAFVTGSRAWNEAHDRAFERRFSALHGVATFWRLADDAIDEFNALVQPGYRVFPGSVHVFQPNLDTEDPLDARRHWWFSAAEVADTTEKSFWMRLHQQAMRWALHQPLPAALQLVNAEFTRAHTSALTDLFSDTSLGRRREAIARLRSTRGLESSAKETVRPERPDDAVKHIEQGLPRSAAAEVRSQPAVDDAIDPVIDAVTSLLADAETLFGLKAPQDAELSGRLQSVLWAAMDQTVGTPPITDAARREVNDILTRGAELESEVEELSALLALADDAYEEAQADLQAQRQLADIQRRRADHVAAELARVAYGADDVVWDVPELDADDPINKDAPTTVDELFAYLELLPAVQFTGNRKAADRIASAKLRSVILADAWTFACELELYARQWEGGVRGLRKYAEEKSARITPSSFASDESNDVKSNSKFSGPRTLPVPLSVDASGSVFMGAHFRLSQDNGKAMRMHVYDAVNVDGRIYIGYIGEHLPSRLTT